MKGVLVCKHLSHLEIHPVYKKLCTLMYVSLSFPAL